MRDCRPIAIRLPADLKEWIEAQAAINGSSQNSEVIRAIRERMDRHSEPATT
ncbi:Arc family DNA-binding protein [Roseicitreum antarcticum]|uniref:Arc-like DNA binding domain-containing protein n=1 Tax=Roseicitreum antarcticum TaxID=564137 RepID=A0A1H2ZVH3_9RHOB|nr:Arc family DNA-binding protein [Roseicitreum antarcticum]SDX21297.1 Arc-like DNA binding domain-containing protein [Roseicitreum antarcticum]